MSLLKIGFGSAIDAGVVIGKAMAIESAYLNQLVMMKIFPENIVGAMFF